ncbi:F-box only protein 42 [Homalodisca vitripennis]|uniref:F-box only protein 42 n=1 Tax=Homalodisca vitripennis TaxID=197043 RepID=UPI001EEA9983|nr:F-box only protein 42 [Homalodisca vitripennis]
MDLYKESASNLEKCHINDLPDEIIEYILSLLRPYDDLKKCMLVSKRWNKNALHVFLHTKNNFNRCLTNFNIKWEHYTPPDKGYGITKRYSHSACSYGNSMYVFGGCTCTSTTFNDLWQLDLSSRKWNRLLTMGTYPTPKALATIVYYEGLLVLFGGWTHPTPFPLHQAWRTFNELHMYDINENRWSCVMTPTLSPPSMAGHSATVHKDQMVVFGGICGQMVTGSANNIWCFNFLTQSWRNQETTEPKPIPRYNQSQIAIDDDHLLIIGGCGGRPSVLLNDVWLLIMQGNVWQWVAITVENPQWGTSHPSNGQLWCHPACKSGTNVIAIGRNPTSTFPTFSLAKWNPAPTRPPSDDSLPRRASDGCTTPRIDRDVNVNGRRGSLTPRNGQASAEPSGSNTAPAPSHSHDPDVDKAEAREVANCSPAQRVPDAKINPIERNRSPFSSNRNINLPTNNNMAAFRSTPSNSGNKHRERQLEVLHRMEERLRNLSRNPQPKPKAVPIPPPVVRQSPPKMAMFVMDISTVLTDHCVRWLPIKSVAPGGPEHTILYSLVSGQGEIIMFGGIQKDVSLFSIEEASLNVINTVTNTVHFITAPQTVI